jgi:hypothetical protein
MANKDSGANTLLAYFHYCKNTYPFSPDYKQDDVETLADLKAPGSALVQETKSFVSAYSKSLSPDSLLKSRA